MRVLVADDHPAMRRAMARLVSEHDSLDLVGEANDGHAVLGLIDTMAPDVALLDVRMPKLDGLGLLRRLRAEGYGVRVLLISGYEDGAIAHEAISQGAAGFLSKESDEAEIAAAIIEVANGRSVLSPHCSRRCSIRSVSGRPSPCSCPGASGNCSSSPPRG